MNNKLKSLAATTAITLATVGTPAFADEVTPTVETNTDTVVSTTETTVAETPKASADVKPALDAQQAVVADTQAQVNAAQSEADAANQAITDAQAGVDAATQAVSDAEANAAAATPENIAANQADQAANLADQTANAAETEQVNAEIAAQTQTVTNAQTAVDTAQAEKDQADSTVTAKEADVKSAQDALSGTGLAEAETNLDQAKQDVATATANVATATAAVDTAKKADADRDAKIKAAETDVNTKSDAVDTAKARVTTAQDDVKTTTETLTSKNDAVKNAQDALKNVDTISIADLTQFKADKTEGDSDFMTDSGATVIEQSSTKIGEDDKSTIVTIGNLTKKQQEDISLYAAQVLTEIRKQLGVSAITVTDDALASALKQAQKYALRGTSVSEAGHISGDYVGENISLALAQDTMTMYDLKTRIYNGIMGQSFADAPSNWGHLQNNLKGNHIGLSVVNVNGDMHIISVIQTAGGTVIPNTEDPTTLQANLDKAQAEQVAAQTASDNAKAKLTQASADYATALDAKTKAEKILNDAMATPLQTQVAENNLRLANIALKNAQERQADAQAAVDNFTANLATKKAKLDEAKAALDAARADQAAKAEVLETATSVLAKQTKILDSLNAEKTNLLAEKDRLVEEAKALATELDGYMKAPAILAEAKAKLTEKEATLADKLAEAKVAQEKLEALNVKLAEEKAKLAELQSEYDKLKDLEDKAKDNVIATLPDGTVVTKPKDAPVVDTLAKDKNVKVVDGNAVVMDKPNTTTTKQADVQQVTYAKTFTPASETNKVSESTQTAKVQALPETGDANASVLQLFGWIGLITGAGIASRKRKKTS